jgi:hypothetical protein
MANFGKFIQQITKNGKDLILADSNFRFYLKKPKISDSEILFL